MVDTSSLIRELSSDLSRASPTQGWAKRYAAYWIVTAGAMGLLAYVCALVWPEKVHPPEDLSNFRFWIETSLWLVASIASGIAAYRSAFPGALDKGTQSRAYALIAMLVAGAFVQFNAGGFAQEFHREMDLYRAGCGVYILVTGVLASVSMFWITRQAAPTRLVSSGAWNAATAGCLGSLFMHLVCEHENTLHLLIWHFTPVVLISVLGGLAARRFLRW